MPTPEVAHIGIVGTGMIGASLSIHRYLYPTLCNATAPQDLVRVPFERGDLGCKTGRGILDWSSVDIDELRRRGSAPYLAFFNWNLPEA